jgi:hypothetical protein
MNLRSSEDEAQEVDKLEKARSQKDWRSRKRLEAWEDGAGEGLRRGSKSQRIPKAQNIPEALRQDQKLKSRS